MSLDTILSDIKVEGENPFPDTGEKTSTESATETKQETEKPNQGDGTEVKPNTDDDNIPFHKHPRWIEKENELKTLREKDEQRDKEMSELRSFREEYQKKSQETSSSKIPTWFKNLYGENDAAWNEYNSYEKNLREEIKREFLSEQEHERTSREAETKRWSKWIDDEVGKLQGQGHQFDRNELIKTMLEYRPTDENGNLDFTAGYKILETLKIRDSHPEKSEARKKIADSVTRSSRGDSKPRDYRTSADFKGRGLQGLQLPN